MTAASVVRLLADPARLRVFAAVVLGARTPADVANATGLSTREEREPAAPVGPLHPFVCGDQLVSLSASPDRRWVVLEHVASRAFTPDTAYREPEVNAALRSWCDGGEVDHVTIRRYLIDMGLLTRTDGVYRLGRVAADEAEQPVL